MFPPPDCLPAAPLAPDSARFDNNSNNDDGDSGHPSRYCPKLVPITRLFDAPLTSAHPTLTLAMYGQDALFNSVSGWWSRPP